MLALLDGRRVPLLIWTAAGMAIIGVGLLSYDASRPNVGDVWTLACAFIYAVFIYRLEWASRRFAALPLTAVSMIVVALLSGACIAVAHEGLGPMPWLSI